MELNKIVNDPHFLQIASLLSVAQSAGWRVRHPKMKSVRSTLDELARFIKGGTESFNESDSLKHQFAGILTVLLAEIVMQDEKLQYGTDDAQWIFESLYSDDASLIFSMLFAVSVAQQRWYTAEEVAALSGEKAGTWKNRAAAGEVYAVEKAGKTWIFPALTLHARGVALPPVITVEVNEEIHQSDEENS